jgi:hypothetical protein
MKLRKTTAGVMLLVTAIAANAAPVYLECDVENPGGADAASKVLHFKITLDETAKTAEFLHPVASGGKASSLQAQFMQTEVTFKYVFSGPLSWEYKIDRTTLAITEKQSTGTTRKGSCKIADPVERKF